MPDKVYFWVFFRACLKFNHLKPKYLNWIVSSTLTFWIVGILEN
jgi:hypothetical protein